MESFFTLLTEFLKLVRVASRDQSRTMRAVLLTVVLSVALTSLIMMSTWMISGGSW